MDKQSASYQLLYPLEFCVFDLESTGGNPKTDRIIEIGLVKIKNLKIVDKKNYLINPEREIPDFIQKLTNIKPEDVINSHKIEDVIDDIVSFIGDSILVAHNTAFDIPFLNSVLEKLEKPQLKNKALCTNLMTKYMIPNLMSTNLQYMSQVFNLGQTNAHRALDDAMASAELLLRYLDVFINKNINKVNSLYYPKNKFELDRIHLKKKEFQNIDLLKNEIENIFKKIKSPFIVIAKGNEGLILQVFPSSQNDELKSYISKNLNLESLETLTIKLTGPISEAIIEALSMYQKLDQKEQVRLIQFIEKHFLKGGSKPSLEECKNHLLSFYTSDFILFNHLIPGQIRIIPVDSLYQKLDVVLRYPGHANKLVQFLGSKMSRISQGRLKRDNLPPEVKQILIAYINSSDEIFKIKKIFNKKDFELIKNDLDSFIETTPNNYDFPNTYL